MERSESNIPLRIGIGIVFLLITGLLLSLVNIEKQQRMYAISTFTECKDAGYPILESYPEQCTTSDGRSFTNSEASSLDPIDPTDSNQKDGCVIAGCSAQLCISAEEASQGGGVSTCEFRAAYACYKGIVCGKQADGMCGWTQSESLTQCLAYPPALDAIPQTL